MSSFLATNSTCYYHNCSLTHFTHQWLPHSNNHLMAFAAEVIGGAEINALWLLIARNFDRARAAFIHGVTTARILSEKCPTFSENSLSDVCLPLEDPQRIRGSNPCTGLERAVS